MRDKLKISKRLAWIAFVMYVVSLFLPYLVLFYSIDGYSVDNISLKGSGFLIFAFFVIILFALILLRHSFLLKWLSVVLSNVFVIFCLSFALYFEVPSFRDLIGVHLFKESNVEFEVGFFLCLFSSFLFLIASIIKFRTPISEDKKSNNELIDDLQ